MLPKWYQLVDACTIYSYIQRQLKQSLDHYRRSQTVTDKFLLTSYFHTSTCLSTCCHLFCPTGLQWPVVSNNRFRLFSLKNGPVSSLVKFIYGILMKSFDFPTEQIICWTLQSVGILVSNNRLKTFPPIITSFDSLELNDTTFDQLETTVLRLFWSFSLYRLPYQQPLRLLPFPTNQIGVVWTLYTLCTLAECNVSL